MEKQNKIAIEFAQWIGENKYQINFFTKEWVLPIIENGEYIAHKSIARDTETLFKIFIHEK